MHTSRMLFKCSDLFFIFRNYTKNKSVICEKNIPYDQRFGKFTCGDIYYAPSKKRGRYPIFVNIHGGGFVAGDKKHRRAFAEYIADKGYFVFNVNHRLAPKYPFPAGIEDALNALNFVLTLADKYELDTNKIIISGDSAGAYYAAAALCSIYDKSFQDKLNLPVFNGKIKAFASFCGLFDPLKSMWKKSPLDIAKDVARCLLGIGVKDDIKDYPFIKDQPFELCQQVMAQELFGHRPQTLCGGQGEMLEEN